MLSITVTIANGGDGVVNDAVSIHEQVSISGFSAKTQEKLLIQRLGVMSDKVVKDYMKAPNA